MTRDINRPDWLWYARHKDRLDKDAQALIEAGHLNTVGFPEGADLGIIAKSIVTVLDKNPQLATGEVRPNGKPLTSSEKRAQKRSAGRQPDEVIELQLDENSKGYKHIPAGEYKVPSRVPFINKDGKKLPDDWVPVEHVDCQA